MIRLFLSIPLLPFSPVALARFCCPSKGPLVAPVLSLVAVPSSASFVPPLLDPPSIRASPLLPRGEHRIIVKRRKGMREGVVGVACGRTRPFHSRGRSAA